MRRSLFPTLVTLVVLAIPCDALAINVGRGGVQQAPRAQTSIAAMPIPPEMTQRFQRLHSGLQQSATSWVRQQAQIVARQPAPDLISLETAIRNRFAGPRAGRVSEPTRQPGNHLVAGGIQGADIEALAFIVMMEATKDAEQDLQNVMQEVQRNNQRKQAARQAIGRMQGELSALKLQGANNNPTAPCAISTCQALLGHLRGLSSTPDLLPRPLRLPASDRVTYGELAQLQQQLRQELDSVDEIGSAESLRLQMEMDRRSKFMEALSDLMKKTNDTSGSVIQNLK